MRLHICHKRSLSIVFATAAFFTFQWLWLPLILERREEGTRHFSAMVPQTWFKAHAKVSLRHPKPSLVWQKMLVKDLNSKSNSGVYHIHINWVDPHQRCFTVLLLLWKVCTENYNTDDDSSLQWTKKWRRVTGCSETLAVFPPNTFGIVPIKS